MGRRRRKATAAFSLFAFQDIITSVTGIVILITLLLAIELMDRTQQSPEQQTSKQIDSITSTIADLESQIDQLKNQMAESAKSAAGLPSTDMATLAMMSQSLDADIDRLNRDNERLANDLRSKSDQLERQKSSHIAKQVKRKDEMDQLKDDILIAEQKIKDMDDNNRKFFRSGIKNKTTWLVEITHRGFLAAPLGGSASPKSFSSISEFSSWVGSVDGSKTAFYLVVKPGGKENFGRGARVIRSNQLEYGFQVGDGDKVFVDPKSGAGA